VCEARPGGFTAIWMIDHFTCSVARMLVPDRMVCISSIRFLEKSKTAPPLVLFCV